MAKLVVIITAQRWAIIVVLALHAAKPGYLANSGRAMAVGGTFHTALVRNVASGC
jgi:hypothetical protein